MNFEPAGKLCKGFIVLNSGQSNFRFELWTMCFTFFTRCQILLNFGLIYSLHIVRYVVTTAHPSIVKTAIAVICVPF